MNAAPKNEHRKEVPRLMFGGVFGSKNTDADLTTILWKGGSANAVAAGGSASNLPHRSAANTAGNIRAKLMFRRC